jgi:lysozyme family protein
VADFQKAFPYLINNEGTTLFEDKDTGEISKYGISLKWLKTVNKDATAEDIRTLTLDEASALYEKYWWKDLNIPFIDSDRIATKVMDTCVNCGAVTGVKILQRAVCHFITVACDGRIGPSTARAIAAFPEEQILNELCLEQAIHYGALVEQAPSLRKNYNGWLARAAKTPLA